MTLILDLCGGTGAWSDPYKQAGYTVNIITLPNWDVRLYPSMISNVPRMSNLFEDIRPLIGKVHGILCAPPCTVFANAGNRWSRSDVEIIEGLSVVDACLRICYVLKPKWWALENPTGKLRKWMGDPIYSFQPCDFGDPYTKNTLLWGNFNTNLIKNPVIPTQGSKMHLIYGGKSDKTKMLRSITPAGFASAFFQANP